MQVIQTPKLIIHWTVDGLKVIHRNGAVTVVPLAKFEAWLIRQLRGEL